MRYFYEELDKIRRQLTLQFSIWNFDSKSIKTDTLREAFVCLVLSLLTARTIYQDLISHQAEFAIIISDSFIFTSTNRLTNLIRLIYDNLANMIPDVSKEEFVKLLTSIVGNLDGIIPP